MVGMVLMRTKKCLIVTLLLLTVPSVQAEWSERVQSSWDSTKEKSEAIYERSKAYIEDSLSLSDTLHTVPSKEALERDNTAYFSQVWPDVIEHLDEALVLNTKIDNAPESRFFGSDKDSLGEEQEDVFAQLESLLESPSITRSRKAIDRLNEKINNEKVAIAQAKEQRVVAIGKEREKYNASIKAHESTIRQLQEQISKQKSVLKHHFNLSGLLLSDEQLDVLLARVDADDTIKMALIYDVLSDITSQLMALAQESGESIEQARRYYGMYVVLLKFAIKVQSTYINKLDEEYLPKIEHISQEAHVLQKESKQLLRSSQKASSREIVKKNLEAQQLTLRVLSLYKRQLQKQKKQIVKARALLFADYNVAKNTYDTVKISADLIHLMQSDQTSFSTLMDIQVPPIIPFENLDMQRKFEEISLRLK